MTIDTRNEMRVNPREIAFTVPVVNIPDEVHLQAVAKAREAYTMELLKAGEISSGKAASILGISRLDMIDRAAKEGISIFDDSQNLEGLQREIERANAILDRQNIQ
jgi:predicted HTH domain antitoxin